MSSVAITGMGIISAIGNNRHEVLQSLTEHQTGIRSARYLTTKHQQYPVGEVQLSNEQLAQRLQLSEPVSRATMLGLAAAKEAVAQAELLPKELETAFLISGTCVGGMDITEKHFASLNTDNSFDKDLAQHPCGAHTQFITANLGIKGYSTTLSTACSSALNAISLGVRLIESNEAKIVIVGGAECLTNYHFNGFRTLHILDEQPCRPFDANRAGINLGEGAAFLVLESDYSCFERGIQPIAYITGIGNACDAFHQTASSDNGEGAYLAMQKALADAYLEPENISYLNAHGTGTPNNDQSESYAIRRVFGSEIPPISSTKGFTGHTTAASGAIESVICLLAMQNNFIPVNLNWKKPMPEDGIVPYIDRQYSDNKDLQNVMCNAFGFGGNDSSIIFSLKHNNNTSKPEDRHLYIKCCSQISAQQPLSEEWMVNPIVVGNDILPTIDPDFSNYISAGQARRMGPLLKRALATALKCMRESGIDHPDAIIAGTGLGCIANTENFLRQIIDNQEEMLTPTQFMQSTHNTISSLLAIQTQTHSYNSTYSHLDNSFESCLFDIISQALTSKKQPDNILIGAYDELTPLVAQLLRKAGLTGQLSETAMSMIITQEPTHCEITDVMPPMNSPYAVEYIESFIEDDDCLLLGINGDPGYDKKYTRLITLYQDLTQLHYKHLFGENLSSSGMGIYVAAQCILNDTIPQCLHYQGKRKKHPKGIVFANYTYNNQLSVVRLQRHE